MMERIERQSCIRGYHVYQHLWTPVMDEVLTCAPELADDDIFNDRGPSGEGRVDT